MPQQRGDETNFKSIRDESMKFNKQELRKAAEKATEGNYVVGHCDINKHGNLSSVYVCQEWNGMAGGVVAECHVNCLTKNSDQVYANAGFMALASPANVISLLEEISTLESRCAELAVENAGLKESRKNLAEFIHEELDADYPLNMDIETPVTDVFLAEVRAQGVESFAESQKEYVRKNRNELDSMTRAAYCGSAVDAERFAALLRKGVQS